MIDTEKPEVPLEIRAWWNWPYGIDDRSAAYVEAAERSDEAFKLDDYM